MYKKRYNNRILSWIKFFFYIASIRGEDGSNTIFHIPPKNWDTLCPYTDICGHKAARTQTFPVSKMPCCSTCSCDEDCGLYRNCCQYSMDKYRLDEKYEATCTSLTTYDKDTQAQFYETHMFKIIDKCPNSTSCYNFKVSKFGSMYPVVSTTTHVIFVNEQCALCHGDGHVLFWNIELNCEVDKSGNIYSSGTFESYLKKLIDNDICDIRFIPPPNVNLNFHRCSIKYPSTVTECLLKRFGKIIDAETQQLCYSYNASFLYMRSKFANIHCFLCSSDYSVQQICDANDYVRLSTKPFSFLLTSNEMSRLDNKMAADTTTYQGRCKSNERTEKHSGSCRRFRCPITMIETGGQCSRLKDSMIAGPFLSYLKLQAINDKQSINRSELIESAITRKLFPNVLRSWSKDFYKPAYSSSIEYLIVRLVHPRRRMNIKKVFKTLQDSIENPWFLKLEGRRHKMIANIHNQFEYVDCNINNTLIYISHFMDLNCTMLGNSDEEKLEPIQGEYLPFAKQIYMYLTKFFFCNHVDLKKEEYEMRGDKLFFKLTNFTYNKMEYQKHLQNISLCLSDFGDHFWLPLNSSKVVHFQDLIINVLVLLIQTLNYSQYVC